MLKLLAQRAKPDARHVLAASLLRGKRYVHDEQHGEAALSAAGAGWPRAVIAEEIEESERRLASPEPVTRYRKER